MCGSMMCEMCWNLMYCSSSSGGGRNSISMAITKIFHMVGQGKFSANGIFFNFALKIGCHFMFVATVYNPVVVHFVMDENDLFIFSLRTTTTLHYIYFWCTHIISLKFSHLPYSLANIYLSLLISCKITVSVKATKACLKHPKRTQNTSFLHCDSFFSSLPNTSQFCEI